LRITRFDPIESESQDLKFLKYFRISSDQMSRLEFSEFFAE